MSELVEDIDTDAHTVHWRNHNRGEQTPYDTLVVAAGAGQSYFGNDRFATFAPGMKSIDDALELRARIFGAFELAELETDEDEIDDDSVRSLVRFYGRRFTRGQLVWTVAKWAVYGIGQTYAYRNGFGAAFFAVALLSL